MKKYIFIILLISLTLLVSADEIQISNEGEDTGRTINLDLPVITPFDNSTFNQSLTDATYLRLDTTNDPLTGNLDLDTNDLITSSPGRVLSPVWAFADTTGVKMEASTAFGRDSLTISAESGTDTDLRVTLKPKGSGVTELFSNTGAISFGNDNLATTGTLAAGATTISGTLDMTSNNITDIGFLIASDGSQIRFSAPPPFSGFAQSITIATNQSLGPGIIT